MESQFKPRQSFRQNSAEDAFEHIGISKDQAAAIKLIAQRSGDQIGRVFTSLIEDALIMILSGQHQVGPPFVSTAKSSVSRPVYKLLNAAEIAKALDISKSQAYHLMLRGEIKTVRFGRSVRTKPEDLEEFIKNNRGSDV